MHTEQVFGFSERNLLKLEIIQCHCLFYPLGPKYLINKPFESYSPSLVGMTDLDLLFGSLM
jgi:hypothetical protein